MRFWFHGFAVSTPNSLVKLYSTRSTLCCFPRSYTNIGLVKNRLNYRAPTQLISRYISKMNFVSRMSFGTIKAELTKKMLLVEEANDSFPVYTLTFKLPPGQSDLGVRIDHGDVVKIMIPNYKPKSYSMSDKRDGEFDITFKVYPGGRCSGYLNNIGIGESMECFKRGSKSRNPGSWVGLVAYGVGITEIFPLAVAELNKPEAREVRLLWASKRYRDKFWLDQIASLKEKHKDRFRLITILSREDKEGSLKGRINKDVLKSVFDGPFTTSRDSVRFMCIGTKPMMNDTYEMFRELNYDIPGVNKLLM